ncbi:hypothetical protein L7F22_015036 [Adiantum nelumboides]|nr:hypothetical protein [Adiantum nelumboides]
MKRSLRELDHNEVSEANLVDKIYSKLMATLPQQLLDDDSVIAKVAMRDIKKQLTLQAKLTLIFGFSGRIPNGHELLQWLQHAHVIDQTSVIDYVSYLAKGFLSIKFKDVSIVAKILGPRPVVQFSLHRMFYICSEPEIVIAAACQSLIPYKRAEK